MELAKKFPTWRGVWEDIQEIEKYLLLELGRAQKHKTALETLRTHINRALSFSEKKVRDQLIKSQKILGSNYRKTGDFKAEYGLIYEKIIHSQFRAP